MVEDLKAFSDTAAEEKRVSSVIPKIRHNETTGQF
jgi:hypothetical protein